MDTTLSRIVKEFSTRLDSEVYQDHTVAGFSNELDQALIAAHLAIQSKEILEVSKVADLLTPFQYSTGSDSLWSVGSDSQRLNGEYLLARCSYAQHSDALSRNRDGQYELNAAIVHFNKALKLSDDLGDNPSLVALHIWLAECHHQVSHHDQAYQEYAAAERALLRIPSTASLASAIMAMRFTLNLRLASHDWERGNFDRGERHITHASNLLAHTRTDPTLCQDKIIVENVFNEAFQTHWIRALLDYVGGRPIRAYSEGSKAVNLLSQNTSPTNLGRFLGLIAEFAMNLVAAQCSYDPVDYPVFMLPGALQESRNDLDQLQIDKLMESVRELLGKARTYARQGKDEIGRALNDLSARRAARLTSLIWRKDYAAHITVDIANRVINQAGKARDVNLEGRALVTRGDAWLMDKQPALAADDYHHAFRLFQEHHLGGLSFWPQQKLLALQQRGDKI